MGNGYQADIHDLQLSNRGTALLASYNPIVCDRATMVSCTNGATVLEAVVQEIDVATGAVLFEWHSLDHIPLGNSYAEVGATMVDYFHINSVDWDTDGNLIMSARNTSALYKINSTPAR